MPPLSGIFFFFLLKKAYFSAELLLVISLRTSWVLPEIVLLMRLSVLIFLIPPPSQAVLPEMMLLMSIMLVSLGSPLEIPPPEVDATLSDTILLITRRFL